MIIIEPLGGLANRMRVIASGLWLKCKLNTELIIVWNVNYELNCPYHLLFEPGDFKIVAKKRNYRYIRSSHQNNAFQNLKSYTLNKFAGIDYCITEKDFPELIWQNKIDITKIACKNIYIQTCQEFGDNMQWFKSFIPIASLQELITRSCSNFSKDTLGIHIRRADHGKAIKHSPLELFVSIMQRVLAARPSVMFFVSTDSIETEVELKRIFGEHIITNEKEITRNTIKGIQDAVVDMYSLASTQKIYGSYWSSFSDIAARIGHIPLEVVQLQLPDDGK